MLRHSQGNYLIMITFNDKTRFFSRNNPKTLKFVVDWYEDMTPSNKFTKDVVEEIRTATDFEVYNDGLNTYTTYHMDKTDFNLDSYGNFGQLKARATLKFKLEGEKKMAIETPIKDKKRFSTLSLELMSFLSSFKESQKLIYKDKEYRITKLKEEPNYQSYWFRIASETKNKIIAISPVTADDLPRELALSIDNMG